MNKERHTTKIFFTQTLNSIISGILTIVIPLLMVERNIDIVTIGFVFAAMPLVFQTIRLLFGAISDIIGRKFFFVLNSLLNIVVLIIYSVAATPFIFLSGKVMEGVKNASIWSVNRASLLDFRKDKRRILAKMIGVTHIASAIGNIAAGFLILWLSYTNTIVLAIFLAILSVPAALSLKIKKTGRFRKVKIKQILDKIDIRKKDNRFKKFTVLSLINGLTMGFVTGYIFPVFLNENGFGVEIIGLILGFNVLLIGISSIATRRVEIKKLIVYGGILY
jgi:MFS family permease